MEDGAGHHTIFTRRTIVCCSAVRFAPFLLLFSFYFLTVIFF